MNYDEFLTQVGQRGGPTNHTHADAATKLVLATLGQRLTGREPHDLASQLPPELQSPLTEHVGAPEIGDDLDQFLHRISDREGYGCDTEQALAHSRAVLSTIASFVSEGEMRDLRAQLPAGYTPLFEPA